MYTETLEFKPNWVGEKQSCCTDRTTMLGQRAPPAKGVGGAQSVWPPESAHDTDIRPDIQSVGCDETSFLPAI